MQAHLLLHRYRSMCAHNISNASFRIEKTLADVEGELQDVYGRLAAFNGSESERAPQPKDFCTQGIKLRSIYR